MPSSLCFEKGGGLAGGYEHSDRSDRREASEGDIVELTEKENVTQRQKLWPISTSEFQSGPLGRSRFHRSRQESKARCVEREDSP